MDRKDKMAIITSILLLGVFLNCANIVDGAILYTRWGRQTCGTLEAELVYTGYVGGSDSQITGGGSNYLCMPRSPTFGNDDAEYHEGGYLYGVQYHFNYGNFPFDVPNETPLLHQNAVCAVCAVENASLVLMIPGRVDCYPGWTLEYTGYLVTEKWDNVNKGEFVCLDKSPDIMIDGGEDGDWTASFYPVEALCGSLPCPPYQHQWEIACVVCSKRF